VVSPEQWKTEWKAEAREKKVGKGEKRRQ